MSTELTRCDSCGEPIEIGSWPFCPDHGRPIAAKGFEPYFDVALGIEITNPGDKNKAMRPRWENDHIIKFESRDRSEREFREMKERHMERAAQERNRK